MFLPYHHRSQSVNTEVSILCHALHFRLTPFMLYLTLKPFAYLSIAQNSLIEEEEEQRKTKKKRIHAYRSLLGWCCGCFAFFSLLLLKPSIWVFLSTIAYMVFIRCSFFYWTLCIPWLEMHSMTKRFNIKMMYTQLCVWKWAFHSFKLSAVVC